MSRLTSTLLGATMVLGGVAPAVAGPEAAMDKAGCTACHAKDSPRVGPSFKAIAAKYKGQDGVAAQLFAKVRAGGKGSFGQIPMSPNPPEKISDADLKAAIDWILKVQ